MDILIVHENYYDCLRMFYLVMAFVLQILAESRPGRNIAFSPYGLASVSMLLYEGASGTSALQLSQALQLPYDAVYARVGFRDLYRHLRVSTFPHSREKLPLLSLASYRRSSIHIEASNRHRSMSINGHRTMCGRTQIQR